MFKAQSDRALPQSKIQNLKSKITPLAQRRTRQEQLGFNLLADFAADVAIAVEAGCEE